MNKKTLIVFVTILLIMVSCEIVNRNKHNDDTTEQAMDKGVTVNGQLAKGAAEPAQPILEQTQPGNVKPAEPLPSPPSEPQPVTQWDSKALDAAVIEDARLHGTDPKTHRMLHRTDYQAKVYRMIGMFVIVSDNGEEVFLPDEL